MSEQREDLHGPAFACAAENGHQPGMAIRTYIATAVMSALISGRMADGNDYPDREITAANSVAYADALIAALAARKEK